MNDSASNLAQFFGRLHLLLVHLPVGIILLLAALEALSLLPRFKNAAASARVIVFLSVPAVLLSVACGWLLAQGGGYDAVLLERHRWLGVAVAAAVLLTWLLHRGGAQTFYRLSLAFTVVVLTVASHLGGSLTHGQDFLTRHAPEPLRSWLGSKPREVQNAVAAPIADRPAFDAVVKPILDKYCVACHGPEKAKGSLRVDSCELLFKGGESGPIILSGKSAESALMTRLHLPMSHDDHMPPDGKPQPTPDELARLKWWIDAGASADKTLQQLHAPESVLRLTAGGTAGTKPEAPSQPQPKADAPRPLEEIMPLAEKLMDEINLSISPIAANESWLQCNASLEAASFSDTELARLAPLSQNLRWLDLGGTRVTDTGVVHLAGMPHLQRLHLNGTAITDQALTNLAGFTELAYLNLVGTAVTDEGLKHLEKLPALRQLYLWQTRTTPAAAQSFAESRTDKAQIGQWQQEITALESKIRQQVMLVNTGAPVPVVQSTNATAINTNCPVSGKPVDKTKTTLYQGKLVAFCCDNCKGVFEKDPKPHLAKLGLVAAAEATPPK